MAVAVGDQRRNKEAQEFLVQEIAKGEEDGIANLLRTAIERGWFTSLPGFLVEAKKKKETEIDRICSRHYTDFLGSVHELLKMKGSVQELRALVDEINGKFSSTGGELVESLNDLSSSQIERDHVKHLLESAVACKELAGLLTEARVCLERDQHYQAMRIIQSVQAAQSNPLVRPMARHLQTWLPIAKNKLLYAARSEADTFVQSLREKMSLIGGTLLIRQARASLQYYHTSVMNATLSEGGFEGNYMRRELNLSQSARDYSDSMSMSGRVSIALGYIMLNAGSFRLNAFIGKNFLPEWYIPVHFSLPPNKEGSEMVDYRLGEIAPLHKALHIYHELGIVSNFHDHYRHDRREIFSKLVKTFERNANSMGLMQAIPRYFEDLTGFFAIECIMGNMIASNNEIFGKAELEELWIEAMTKLRDVTLLMGITLSSPAELLQLKEEMLLLLHMMADEIIGMDMGVLMTVMWTLFDSFDALSVQYMTLQIQDALDQSAFQRYVVTSPEVYHLQIKHFRLDTLEINQDTPQYQQKFATSKLRPTAGGGGGGSGGNSNGGNNGMLSGHNNGNNIGGSNNLNNNSVNNNSNGEGMRSMMDLDAHLDALEQEMGLSSTVNPATLSSAGPSSGSAATTSSSSMFSSVPFASGHHGSSYTNNTGESSFVNNSSGYAYYSSNNRDDDMLPTAQFITQTYPFSAFVPLILTELQFALTRLFLFVMVPAPESWTRQRRQQDKVARIVGAVSSSSSSNHNNSNNNSADANNSTNSNSNAVTSSAVSAPPAATVGNTMLHLATYAGVTNLQVTDFLCRNLLGLFALLCDQLQASLQKDGAETALSKACQIAIDTTFIALSTDFYFSLLETNLELLFGSEAHDPVLINQTQEIVLSRIRRVSSQAQDLIFELLANKIDALLESLQFIDYAPEYPPPQVVPGAHNHHNNGNNNGQSPSFMVNLGAANTNWIHDSIESLVDFLTITFMCFTHLPQAVREAVHFTSCARLAQGILEFLLSPERVPKINIYALVALDADVKRLMLFADSCGIAELRRCFDELHEMIRAVLHPDLTQLGEDVSFRTNLFPHISTEKLAQLLDKTIPSPVSAFASNLPRLEKAVTKTTAKRLRSPPPPQPQVQRPPQYSRESISQSQNKSSNNNNNNNNGNPLKRASVTASNANNGTTTNKSATMGSNYSAGNMNNSHGGKTNNNDNNSAGGGPGSSTATQRYPNAFPMRTSLSQQQMGGSDNIIYHPNNNGSDNNSGNNSGNNSNGNNSNNSSHEDLHNPATANNRGGNNILAQRRLSAVRSQREFSQNNNS